MPPPAITDARRNERRLTSVVSIGPPAYAYSCTSPGALGMNGGHGLFYRLLGSDFGCLVNGFANAQIGAAAADVAVHGGVNVRVRGMRILREQRGSGHHLAGLAVSALRHVN